MSRQSLSQGGDPVFDIPEPRVVALKMLALLQPEYGQHPKYAWLEKQLTGLTHRRHQLGAVIFMLRVMQHKEQFFV